MPFLIEELEERVDNNAVTLILHGEQLGVLENSVSLLEERVNVLENTDVTMQESLDALEATDVITDDRLNELEIAVNDTTVQEDLSERVMNLENITSLQTNEIDDLVIKDGAHDNDIAAIQDVNNKFEQRISLLEGSLEINNISVGFHARLTNRDLPVGTPIMYDDVIFNAQGGYSPDTGIFIANIPGLYYFEQYWVMDYRYPGISLYIWKNNEIQCYSYGNNYADGDNNSPSCSATIELLVHDEVYVTSSGVSVYSSPQYTGFTGFLIKAYV